MQTKIIAGTMNWGVWGKNLNTSQMATIIETYLEIGITVFDHADIYGGHTTEEAFGAAFKTTGINRDQVQFISKCGIKYPAPNRNYALKHYDYSRAHLIFSVENSLRNLQTDYLDLLLLHRPSPLLDVREVSDTIQELQKSGKIKKIGVSNFTPSQMALLQKEISLDCNQIQCSLTHFDAMLDGTLDYMQTNAIKPMAWNPLGSIYREDSEHIIRIKNILDQLSIKYEVSIDLILLSWLLRHPAGILPVVGTADIQKISNFEKLKFITLELEDWFMLWEASLGHKVP